MTATMYAILLMCISNAGKCTMYEHEGFYVVTGFYKDRMVACKIVDERSAHCYAYSGEWKHLGKDPDSLTTVPSEARGWRIVTGKAPSGEND